MPESPETSAIQQRMAQLRFELDEDVQEIVDGTRELGEWKSYVRAYPWLCLGTAFVLGTWIVPQRLSGRSKDLSSGTANLNEEQAMRATPVSYDGMARGMLLAILGNLVTRNVSTFIQTKVDRFYAARTTRSQRNNQP